MGWDPEKNLRRADSNDITSLQFVSMIKIHEEARGLQGSGDGRPDHLSGSGRVTLGFGSKNVRPCPAHDMVGSGRVGFGLLRNFVCNFRIGSDFLSFGSNISART